MILKLQSNPNEWTLYDHLEDVSYERVPYSQAKAGNAIEPVDASFQDDDLVLWITAHKTNGEWLSIIVTGSAYLLNDNGGTVEHLV